MAMAAAILAGHDALRKQHPGAVLLRSTDWNYDGRFWITVMNERFPTAEEANTWCDTNRFAPQDCFAKGCRAPVSSKAARDTADEPLTPRERDRPGSAPPPDGQRRSGTSRCASVSSPPLTGL